MAARTKAAALMSEGVERVDGATSRPVGHAGVFAERLDRFRAGPTWVGVPAMGVFEVHDGRVTWWRDCFDGAANGETMAPLWS